MGESRERLGAGDALGFEQFAIFNPTDEKIGGAADTEALAVRQIGFHDLGVSRIVEARDKPLNLQLM